MANAFRFKRPFKPEGKLLTLYFEDNEVTAFAGDSVAAALLADGIDFTRTTAVSDSRRAPFCMMGTCFECLMEIDNIPNRQACMVEVAEGMKIRRMHGARDFAHG